MCIDIELHIKSKSPDLVTDLLWATDLLQVHGMHEILYIIYRHGYRAAMQCLGNAHPVTRICSILLKLGFVGSKLIVTLLQCQVDCLEKELGLRHLNTLRTHHSLIYAIGPDEAVSRSQALLAACEAACTDKDPGWFTSMEILGFSLLANRQYNDAEVVVLDLLRLLDATPHVLQAHGRTVRMLRLLTQIFQLGNDPVAAELYFRRSVVEAIASYGPRDQRNIRYMVDHANILRTLKRDEEADGIEAHVQDLLGPPEIIELLGG